MSSNVVEFTGATRHPIDPDKVLEGLKGKLAYVLVVGWGKDEDDGALICASSSADLREAFYALEHYKYAVLQSKWEGDE